MKNFKCKWLLLSVILSIASISQVWATDYAGQSSKSGFNKDGGVKVTFNINGTSTEKTLNRGGMSNINLGTITSALTLNKIQFIYWKNSGNICNGWAYVNSPGDADFGPTQLGWSGSDLLIDNLGWNYMGKDPGTYYITAYFKMEGNANDGSNCGDFYYYSNYKDNDWTTNNQNYTFEFTIPSKNLTIAGAANGNTVSGSQEGIKTGYAYSISATPLTGGYTFSGWTVNSGASSVVIADASSASTTVTFNDYSNDVTITANFTPINYSGDNNILLEDGSTIAGGYNVDYDGTGIAFTAGHVPSKTGYHNTDFYKESSKENKIANADRSLVSETTTYTSDGKWKYTSVPNLYMSWIANTYTITFDDQSATIIGTDEESVTFDAAVSNVTVPKKEGYIFDGYYTGTSGTGVKIFEADGTVVTNANNGAGTDYTVSGSWKYPDDITLYANWTGITYHIQFDANGGTGSMENQDLTYGTSTALTTNAFTRDGYYFLGWNTNPDGSGTAYYGGESVSDVTSTPGETVTLYAQWAQMHTLYFLNMGVKDWQGDGAAEQSDAPRSAYAYISYNGHEMYPLGGFPGRVMTATTSVTLPNVNGSTTTWCWYIENVPDGATIIFNDDNHGHQTSSLTGWISDKPYYCNGNGTWYALDGTNSISQITSMSVFIGAGHFGSTWKFFALDHHNDGTYAIINLNTGNTYEYKYYNWQAGTYSGATTENAYTINGSTGTTADFGGPNGMNGEKNYMVKTDGHATGEYKFLLSWSDATPQTTVKLPRGVTMHDPVPNETKAGELVTVTLSATASDNPSTGSDLNSNPVYYFEFSTDNSNWKTVATVTKPTPNAKTPSTTYTFNAQSGYFRVKLVNDNGVASYSGSTAFTAYSTKSFYVYNPYNSGDWSTLHLYTWKENGDADVLYNGSWPGKTSGSCEHGNAIESKGDNWFYITIDERADCFMLVGNGGCSSDANNYSCHQTVTCNVSNYIHNDKYMIFTENDANYVREYTAKGTNDYRLKYTSTTTGITSYSPIYNTTLDGGSVTTSMWMNANDANASIAIQRYEYVSSSWQWVDKVTYSNATAGFNGLVASGYRSHGYVFQMTLTMNGASSAVSGVKLYNGSYYVRTDELAGGWNVYKNDTHKMTHSETSLTSGTPAYDYYLCKWISAADKNVKFTVANDYNSALVASLEGDVNSSDPLYGRQTLPQAANVRFSWNSQTNTLTRAYLSGATDASSRFLVMKENSDVLGKIYDSKGQPLVSGKGQVSGLNEHELLFEDKGNWVYQLTLMANPGAKAKVTAKYNEKEPDFVNANLIGGSGTSKYTYRIVYDFKTNSMTSAWVASGAPFSEDIELKNNVMLIRNGQGEASQISFTSGHKITEVKKVYGVLQFDRSFVTDEYRSRYARDLYWVSFPFDVNLRDVFGMGTYGTHWIIEYYDGKGRAEHGFWADSPSNWKFVTPAMRETGDDGNGYILEKNVGYIVALDLDELWYTSAEDCSSVWENDVNETFLYFPSKDNIGNIQATTANVDIDQTGYKCTIGPRFEGGDDRRIKDSYWHCIGVPSYANTTQTYSGLEIPDELGTGVESWEPGSTLYFYEWNSSSNTLSIHTSAGYQFKAMHSYMVQYAAGTLPWTSVTNTVPASVAARLNETHDRNYSLALMRESEEEDHTLLRLTDDASVTNRFEFNQDLSKEYNAGRGNIWTVTADTVEVAGNSMPKPLQTTLVPVGVKVVTGGEYTLAMPEGTNGEDVYLIDNAYGTRTNLGLMPYTVTLTAGTYEGRFVLEFAPIQDSPTSLENDGLSRSDELNDANDDVRKVFVGGRLYIIRDGKVYDAAGQRIE